MRQAVDTSTAAHYVWGAGCDGWRLADTPGLSVIEEVVPAGESEQWHRHDRARQFFYILSGTAVMLTSEGDIPLASGQGVSIEPGISHSLSNPGAQEVRFLVISTPSTAGDRIEVEGR